ncbi:Aste57867_406 [Aphanomyces stellatus]|uniref:Aste57867_406 protein n=1 Tax=Aphanomyces stellatus TaxID=120398 RepID=A0A485K2J6_9STRA|nr:hypothetical protein As57867_000405 [Aphanomyces stellatus]VFT77631.1 Aste57867_406 [Aphanomyces stellatus]
MGFPLAHKMKHLLASVTSCIGAAGPHREKYVVSVKVQHKLPATLWYVYKYHADFCRLYDDLAAIQASVVCAQECWLGSMLASLKALLDPTASEKLACLNQFLHKLVFMLQQHDHADVCLLRGKVDAKLKAFLEWRDDSHPRSLKRQLSLPSIHDQLGSSSAHAECLVMESSASKYNSHSFPVKITQLETLSPQASVFVPPSPHSPLGVLNKFRRLNTADEPATPKGNKMALVYQDMFKHTTMSSMPALPARRRVFTEVNFDGI